MICVTFHGSGRFAIFKSYNSIVREERYEISAQWAQQRNWKMREVVIGLSWGLMSSCLCALMVFGVALECVVKLELAFSSLYLNIVVLNGLNCTTSMRSWRYLGCHLTGSYSPGRAGAASRTLLVELSECQHQRPSPWHWLLPLSTVVPDCHCHLHLHALVTFVTE